MAAGSSARDGLVWARVHAWGLDEEFDQALLDFFSELTVSAAGRGDDEMLRKVTLETVRQMACGSGVLELAQGLTGWRVLGPKEGLTLEEAVDANRVWVQVASAAQRWFR